MTCSAIGFVDPCRLTFLSGKGLATNRVQPGFLLISRSHLFFAWMALALTLAFLFGSELEIRIDSGELYGGNVIPFFLPGGIAVACPTFRAPCLGVCVFFGCAVAVSASAGRECHR